MFLTTNRLKTIDPAFLSRIHLTLACNPLDAETRKKLWRFFLSRTGGYQATDWTETTLDEFALFQLNGRQIKNAVRTANSLALSEKHRLSADDIDVVLETIAEYQSVFEPPPSPQPPAVMVDVKREPGLSAWELARPPGKLNLNAN